MHINCWRSARISWIRAGPPWRGNPRGAHKMYLCGVVSSSIRATRCEAAPLGRETRPHNAPSTPASPALWGPRPSAEVAPARRSQRYMAQSVASWASAPLRPPAKAGRNASWTKRKWLFGGWGR